MMSFSNDDEYIYNKIHSIEILDIFNKSQIRSVNIVVKKGNYGSLFVKLRDENSFVFSYSALIDRQNFQNMKSEQSLDIDFDEFETHLLDMLMLNLNKEMLLKLKLSGEGSVCTLIFYEKSRIKSLVYLTIEFSITSQKELFEEMELNMRVLQDTNKKLSRQISSLSDKLQLKEKQFCEHKEVAQELEEKFIKDLRNINEVFSHYLRHYESLLTEKILFLSNKVMKIVTDINVVKKENYLKSESSTRLLQSMENLRIENLENASLISNLKVQCTNLERRKNELEHEVCRLSDLSKNNDAKIMELQNKVVEYRNDLENSALVLAKKTEMYNELMQDMEQANQVIRNYNKHYDTKAQEVEDLKEVITSKDNLIKEQIFQNNQLFKEYHEYKVNFNKEETDRLNLEISEMQSKMEVLEKEKREMFKLNSLLTKKLSAMNIFSCP